MSKEFRLVKPGGVSDVQRPPIDWNLCIVCQKVTPEPLSHPWKGRGRGQTEATGTGYQSFATNVAKFKELGKLPPSISVETLDDGSGVVDTLQKNKASWHKTCRNLLSDLKLQRLTKRAPDQDDQEHNMVSPVKLRRSSIQDAHASREDASMCFFCDKEAGAAGLHEVRTMGMDHTIRTYATELKDTQLLAKLAPGDMVALEAKYHKNCLCQLYNRHKRAKDVSETCTGSDESSYKGIALAELISYMDEKRLLETAIPVFRLSDLVTAYTERLLELNPEHTEKVNSTRLKERLLLHCPYLKAVKQGRDVLLTYDEAVGDAILKACSDEDSEALQLARTALIIRKQLFSHGHTFNGSLCNDSEGYTIPQTLLALVNMILDGPSIKSQANKEVSSNQAAKTISELVIFNSIRGAKGPRKDSVRHNSERETPIPVYLGLKVHAKTRNRDLIDCFHQHGLSISYDRVLGISSSIAHSIIKRFETDGVVCPPQLKKGLFTTGQVDNIDHNPSSVTAADSFHGTAHSLCQHPAADNQGTDRDPIVLAETEPGKRIPPLPLAYTNMLPAPFMPKEIKAPVVHGPMRPEKDRFETDRKNEHKWLAKQVPLIEMEGIAEGDFISWAAYHASCQVLPCKPATTIALMPLFREVSHSFATIIHCMKTNQAATQFLNPGQSPVLTMDQPLYALGKQVQWRFPDSLGEDKYVVMLGPLHIEMAGLKVIGDLLDGTGWSNAIVQAEVATKGTADSFIHVSHVTKSRRAHQVTAAALYVLQRQAFEVNKDSLTNDVQESEEVESFTKWCAEMNAAHPMFRFWSTVLDLELTLLAFVRAIRTSDFVLYVEALSQLAPWFFALDHVHYARWISVHIRDMSNLRQQCPDIYEHFMNGSFTSNKTGNPFSAIGLDQAHEQMNAQVKGDGGAIELTENPGALRRWMVAGLQVSTIIETYEDRTDKPHAGTHAKHHEQGAARQKAFASDVRSLVATMNEIGNPFMDRTKDLLTIDSQEVVPTAVIESLQNIQTLGETKYQTFIKDRLLTNETPISAPIARNAPLLFSRPKHAEKSKDKQKIAELKSDCSLFSRLYIASQSREGDLQEFFKHENQKYPPSLSTSGQLKQGKKSDLVGCLEAKTDSAATNIPSVEAIVLDGAAVVHILSVGESKTFGEYANDVFIPHVLSQLEKAHRVDLVWDVYLKDSLKLSTRLNKGTGQRKRVSPNVRLPGNWKNFLRNDDNKDELFQFLGKECVSTDTGNKVIISTLKDSVITSRIDQDTDGLQPCSHEEADTRIFVHVQDALYSGFKSVMIRTVDTDVVVIAAGLFHSLANIEQLWIAFGTGKDFRYIPIHEIVSTLTTQLPQGLLFFHAFTGCDVTSFFANYGKKSAWKTWTAWPEVNDMFVALSKPCTDDIPEEILLMIERFVVLMYCRTSDETRVDTARMTLFAKLSRSIENIPRPVLRWSSMSRELYTKQGMYGVSHLYYSLCFQMLLTGVGRCHRMPGTSPSGPPYPLLKKLAWN